MADEEASPVEDAPPAGPEEATPVDQEAEVSAQTTAIAPVKSASELPQADAPPPTDEEAAKDGEASAAAAPSADGELTMDVPPEGGVSPTEEGLVETEAPPPVGEEKDENGGEGLPPIEPPVDDEGGLGPSPSGEMEEERKSALQFKERKVSMAAVQEEVIEDDAIEDDALVGVPDELFQGDQSKFTIEAGSDVEAKRDMLEKKKQKILGSIISIRRGDPTYFDRQKVPKYQNSYKLESEKSFNPEKVQQILQDVLEEALTDLTYDHDKIPKQAKWASSAIRAKVKELEYDRYKIVCYVSIGEKLCQDVYTMLRFLWDAERDRYALYVHENMNLFAIGLCFGIYYE